MLLNYMAKTETQMQSIYIKHSNKTGDKGEASGLSLFVQ